MTKQRALALPMFAVLVVVPQAAVPSAQAPASGLQSPANQRTITETRSPKSEIRKAYAVPRTPWGDPRLEGTWSTDDSIGVPVERPAQFGERLYFNEEELADRAKRDELTRRQALEERSAPAPAGGGGVNPPSHWGEQGTRTARQTSFVADPADGGIPAVTPDAQRRAATRDRGSFGDGPFDGPDNFTNYDRCITRKIGRAHV